MIHVYSDSFGETHGAGTWPAKLEYIREEEVKINGSGGTGPNWSLRKLINDLETSKIKNRDSVIFLLSDQKRMEFPWLENEWLADGIFLLAEDIPEEIVKHLKGGTPAFDKYRYKKYEYEIRTMAQSLGPMFLYENVKNITFLHLLSQQFKGINFLVFTCFSLNHFTSRYKNFNITSTKLLYDLDFEELNSSNFYYVSTPVSYMAGTYDGDEMLNNHMTVEQNEKFGIFCNDILNNNTPDTSWFVYKAYDDPYAEHQGSEPPAPLFIYD